MISVLICGDSFAANWPGEGWPKKLAQKYNVKNLAQAGVGEYKILRQIESENILNFDLVIVSHTSPSRVHTRKHPLHQTGLHKDCDLIFNDVDRFSFLNESLKSAKGWFKYHYDEEYQIDIYKMLRQKINSLIKKPYISISHADLPDDLVLESTHIDFRSIWIENRGDVNHYSANGNDIVFQTIDKKIQELL